MQIAKKSMQEANRAKHRSFTDARGLRPPLRQGSHATAARLGQRGWLTERVPATALARLLPRSASTRLNLGGRGAPKNEVAFLATSGANFCGYGSGAEFAGSERFAQRPEGGPPQGAAALARSLREWVLEEVRARVRGEECLRPARRGGNEPGHT